MSHLYAVLLLAAHAFTPAPLDLASMRRSCGRVSQPPCMGRVHEPGDRVLFIDGDNLMSHRKVTKGRDELAAKLAGIRGSRTVLVFDGRRGEKASVQGSNPQVVVTHGGDADGVSRETADEWIENAMEGATESVIEVVTADRRLRQVAHLNKVGTINPAKFWRRYLPRLKGLKTDYSNSPKSDDD